MRNEPTNTATRGQVANYNYSSLHFGNGMSVTFKSRQTYVNTIWEDNEFSTFNK